MEILPVDINGLVAVILGISVVLIPVAGLTLRYALKPVVETLGRFFEHRELDETVQILERRMALMEQQMESVDGNVRRLLEVADFHRALGSGSDAGGRDAGGAGAADR